MAKTKIVCTLGPASSDEQVIADMLRSGTDVARQAEADAAELGMTELIQYANAGF